jgi:hypothetical protein
MNGEEIIFLDPVVDENTIGLLESLSGQELLGAAQIALRQFDGFAVAVLVP